MKKLALLTACILLLIGSGYRASAQYYFYDNNSYDTPLMFELGGSVGIMNCLSDVGGRKGVGKGFVKDLNIGNNQLNGSIYLSATYKEYLALRLEGTFGTIKAYDSILKSVQATTAGRYQRNLSFRSKISEISLVAEFHPFFAFGNYMGRDVEPPYFSPYIVGGIAFFSFNPQAIARNGQYVDLQPLSTEGQGFAEYPDRKPYKLSQVSFPIGVGVRYELSKDFNMRLEFLHRITTTDYLDDVSKRYIDKTVYNNYFPVGSADWQNANDLSSNQRNNTGPNSAEFRKTQGGIRGNPNNKDAYFTFNIKIGLLLGRESR